MNIERPVVRAAQRRRKTTERIGADTRRGKEDRSSPWQQARSTALSARLDKRAGWFPPESLCANGW